MFCLILASFLLTAVGHTKAERCRMEEFYKCAKSIHFNNSIYFDDDDDPQDIRDNCPDRLEAVKCVRKYAPLCMSSAQHTVWIAYAQHEVLQTIEDLCTEGSDLNLAYLKNIGCLKKMEKDIEFCNTMFRKSQNAITSDNSLDTHLKLSHSCCAFEWLIECRERSAEEKCDEDVKSYIEIVTDRQMEQITTSCAAYSPYDEICDELYGVDILQSDKLFSSGSDTNAEKCDMVEYLKCFDAVGFKNGFSFEDNNSSQEFKDSCPDRLEAVKCVRKYAPLCVSPAQYNGENANIMLQIVEDLCTEGTDLNVAYLENIDCLEKMEKDIEFCSMMYGQSIYSIAVDGELEQHEQDSHKCCAIQWMKECRKRSAEVRCDEDAESYIEKITDRQFDQSCAVYSPYNENCDELYGVDVEEPDKLFSNGSDINVEKCNMEEYMKCSNSIAFKNGYSFEDIDNSQEFKDNCPDKLEAVKCVRKYTPLCVSPAQYNEETVNLMLKIVEDLCTEGTDLNVAYLKNIDCLEKMEKDVEFCNTMYAQSQNTIILDESLEHHLKITHSCCAFEWVKECRSKSAEVKCDAEVKSYIEKVTDRQFDQLLVSCADYSPYYENCDELYGVEVGQPGSGFAGGQPESEVAGAQLESGVARGQPESEITGGQSFSSGSMLSASTVILFLSLLFI